MLEACGLPARLTKYGLAANALDAIADESLPAGSTKANPRAVTKADVIAMLASIA